MKREVKIDTIVGKVYFKIATWHNNVHELKENEAKNSLYGLSFDLIKMVVEDLGMQIIESGGKQKDLNELSDKLKSLGIK